ncbi:MAG: hypothetical protein ACU843_07660, partial [Gammaproteobacteria bacterium]
TWAISAFTYGVRFQTFCERHLEMRLGEIDVGGIVLGVDGIRSPRAGADESLPPSRTERDNPLNQLEVNLIRKIFCSNAITEGRQREIRIIPLRMMVKLKSRELLTFTFGFALVESNKLTYFRVQDHLRKAGLGRKALQKLLRKFPDINETECCELPENEFEAPPNENDRRAFRKLFESLRNEVRSRRS